MHSNSLLNYSGFWLLSYLILKGKIYRKIIYEILRSKEFCAEHAHKNTLSHQFYFLICLCIYVVIWKFFTLFLFFLVTFINIVGANMKETMYVHQLCVRKKAWRSWINKIYYPLTSTNIQTLSQMDTWVIFKLAY